MEQLLTVQVTRDEWLALIGLHENEVSLANAQGYASSPYEEARIAYFKEVASLECPEWKA